MLITKIKSWLIPLHLFVVRLIASKKKIPYAYWAVYRLVVSLFLPSKHGICSVVYKRNFLHCKNNSFKINGILSSLNIDAWSLDEETLEFIWKKLNFKCPKCIIEFGSGVSTIIMAEYAKNCERKNGFTPKILSIDQNEWATEKTRGMLMHNFLTKYVKLVHYKLTDSGDYSLDKNEVSMFLDNRLFDCILIDGPAGPDGRRDYTLPSIIEFCANECQWYIDDAFRENEMNILDNWKKKKSVKIEGIYPFERGLAAGKIIT